MKCGGDSDIKCAAARFIRLNTFFRTCFKIKLYSVDERVFKLIESSPFVIHEVVDKENFAVEGSILQAKIY
ncbi:hypothetical protein WS58_06320 [Burkholderia pseudomultivorans]|nr:hypothetical protein WS56_19835 [Burkholderia pseudomultivorans]KVC34580.1 hypothetical protein WS55_33410 [Burkholderia pseudomultivorans]KVC49880.1 hypothetical protein WS58_06320 [Burkholderia pseudomultivorans]